MDLTESQGDDSAKQDLLKAKAALEKAGLKAEAEGVQRKLQAMEQPGESPTQDPKRLLDSAA
eukprot:12935277-Alexandrium_andersonii.AAC.1